MKNEKKRISAKKDHLFGQSKNGRKKNKNTENVNWNLNWFCSGDVASCAHLEFHQYTSAIYMSLPAARILGLWDVACVRRSRKCSIILFFVGWPLHHLTTFCQRTENIRSSYSRLRFQYPHIRRRGAINLNMQILRGTSRVVAAKQYVCEMVDERACARTE